MTSLRVKQCHNSLKRPNTLTGSSRKCKVEILKFLEYRNRIELIQDFDFSATSQRVKITEDGSFIHCVGMYPPTLKIFETA